MGKVKFISDLHLGHTNVAIWRGFNDLETYHKHIITNWNNSTDKRDVIYILGDIALDKKLYYLLDKLKGIKYFILGNHDERQDVAELLKYGKISGPIKYKNTWLTHHPIHPECLQNCINIHGHVHNLPIINQTIYSTFTDNTEKKYYNVSCEVNDFIPQTFEDLGIK